THCIMKTSFEYHVRGWNSRDPFLDVCHHQKFDHFGVQMAKEKAIQPVLGFVGLGVMGKPMATNLIRAGFPVIVFNRSKAKCESLVPLGAAVAQSLSELAAQSDAVITIVSDTMAVEDVIFGQRGLFPGFKRGTTVIDMSTIS